jgi:hypothetical protein
MKQRLASLFLLFVLFGGAFAGVPLGFGGENRCSMSGMANMSCCKAMLKQKNRSKVSAAQLLCALACAKSGTTLPSNAVRVTPPAVARTVAVPATVKPSVFTSLQFQRMDRSHDPPGSPPKYLRNLALLI